MLKNSKHCLLCMQLKPRIDGHYMPKALYKLFIDQEIGVANKHPLFLTSDSYVQTSHQAKAKIFCRDCEDRFNKFGETPVLSSYYRAEGNFPLQDELIKTTPLQATKDLKAYDCSKLNCISHHQLTYFGMSILWKSSIHEWFIGSKSMGPKTSLGPYQEDLRNYLLGINKNLKNIYCNVEVCNSKTPLIGFHPPTPTKFFPFHSFSFSIPGIYFLISLGKKVSKEHIEFSLNHSTWHPILFGGNRERAITKDLQTFPNFHRLSEGM